MVLGDADDRSPERGGVNIELDPCQDNFRNAPRCYNESVALQVPKMSITTIHGANKEGNEDRTASRETRRHILKVSDILEVLTQTI